MHCRHTADTTRDGSVKKTNKKATTIEDNNKTEKDEAETTVKASPGKKKDQAFIQAITIRLTNGLTVTGAYVGPQTKHDVTKKFLKETLNRHGEHHVIAGDLKKRHVSWDTMTNVRGLAVTETASKTLRTHVLAAKEPSYYNMITKEGGE